VKYDNKLKSALNIKVWFTGHQGRRLVIVSTSQDLVYFSRLLTFYILFIHICT